MVTEINIYFLRKEKNHISHQSDYLCITPDLPSPLFNGSWLAGLKNCNAQLHLVIGCLSC